MASISRTTIAAAGAAVVMASRQSTATPITAREEIPFDLGWRTTTDPYPETCPVYDIEVDGYLGNSGWLVDEGAASEAACEVRLRVVPYQYGRLRDGGTPLTVEPG